MAKKIKTYGSTKEDNSAMSKNSNEKTGNLDQLLLWAKKSDLVAFVTRYAEEDTPFKNAITKYLETKYKSKTTTTSHYRKLMKDAFNQTKISGTHYRHFQETDWDAVRAKATELLEEGQKLLTVGNADAAAGIGITFFTSFKENFEESIFEGDDEGWDTGQCCEQAGNLVIKALQSPDLSVEKHQKYLEEIKTLISSNLPHILSNYGFYDFEDMVKQLK